MSKPVHELLKVRKAANDVYKCRGIRGRFPYTYADDFLRCHPELVPSEYVNEVIDSRCAAGLAIERWARGIGVDERELYEVLAEAYMNEFHIYLEEG